MITIDAKELKQFIENDYDVEKHLIIDVRTKEEYLSGHIPYSVNIDLDVIESALPLLNKYDKVFVSCRSGGRSQQACDILNLPNVINVIGGYLSYIE